MLVVGSYAFKKLYPESHREVLDIDVIASKSEVNSLIGILSPENIKNTENIITFFNIKNKIEPFVKDNVEFLLSDNSISLKKYIECARKDSYKYVLIGTELCEMEFASPEILFSLKKSHINFPIKFNKHIKDYCFLYDKFGGVDKLSDITKINFKETEERLGKLKAPALNKTVKEFFGQSNGYVKSFFVHDDIHHVMSHYDKPMYTRMQPDPLKAWCSKSMWDNFSFEDKCKCILEEAMVISLERRIIPMLFGGGKFYSSKDSFDWAFMRVCTTLCSGWFRQFATDNYFRILEYYNPNYVEKFLNCYESGEIKKI